MDKKKNYEKPELGVHGNLTDITRGGGERFNDYGSYNTDIPPS
ncbi:MAG: hypothetical protein ABFC34_10370 [Methanobacterium sp.]